MQNTYIENEPQPITFLGSILNGFYYLAAFFNTIFAVLSTVTLIGIVFITQPQQVMHNVPPSWWIPIMLVMVPSQCLCQFLTWKTIFKRQIPSPKNIAENQFDPPTLLRPVLVVFWSANFLIGFVIGVSLFKPAPGNPINMPILLLLAIVTFALSTFTNVYLMLLARSLSSIRHRLDMAISILGQCNGRDHSNRLLQNRFLALHRILLFEPLTNPFPPRPTGRDFRLLQSQSLKRY